MTGFAGSIPAAGERGRKPLLNDISAVKIFSSFCAGSIAFNAIYLSAAALAIYAVFGSQFAGFSLLIGIPLAAIVVAYEMRLMRKRREAEEESALVSALSIVYSSIKYNGKPLLYSICRAADSLNPSSAPNAQAALLDVAGRMRLGQDLDVAVRDFARACKHSYLSPLYQFAEEYWAGLEPAASLKGVIDDYHAKRRSNAERSISRTQRRVTVCMALGTIAPSFLMFVFVGYSIVYYSTLQYFLFAVSLLLILPFAYSVLGAGMAGYDDAR
ncbi:MAG TPA: hypothetical protein VND15_01860 [Candidatus Acidoferrales bacterium]|nr:hypothetical protein [Candidatus Acidoferrales bacterium]